MVVPLVARISLLHISISNWSGQLGLLLGYLVVGSICYSIMVLYLWISVCSLLTSSFLGVVGRDDCVLAYTRRPYKISWAFRGPCLFICHGLELLVWQLFMRLLLTADFDPPVRFNWIIFLPAELSAASVLIRFWNKEINSSVWIVVCMIVVIAINLLGAGERLHLIQNTPGWFIAFTQVFMERQNLYLRKCWCLVLRSIIWRSIHSSIKVITIIALIILGIVLDLGGKSYQYWFYSPFLPWPIFQVDRIMIDLDSVIGNTLDHLHNLMASAVRKASF